MRYRVSKNSATNLAWVDLYEEEKSVLPANLGDAVKQVDHLTRRAAAIGLMWWDIDKNRKFQFADKSGYLD
jgi:hypothetical protein